jgi:hypothetical protein
MMNLSDTARVALAQCFATRGKHKGQLLARCPRSDSMAAAAWQGAMSIVNPYKLGIGVLMFMTQEQRTVYNEIAGHFARMPKDHAILADRDREALEAWGVW